MTITGTGFAHRAHFFSLAVWSVGQQTIYLATTFVSDSQLTAAIPASLLTHAVTAQMYLQTGDPMSDLPLGKSNVVGFAVTPPPAASGRGTILVYGVSSYPPWREEPRQVSLDGSPWQLLVGGDSVFYNGVKAGDHQLRLSNPCTGTHAPTVLTVTVAKGKTTAVGAIIPGACM